jgi:ABC-type uncharacterized transport system involved in gliding motility auxiliary subunit
MSDVLGFLILPVLLAEKIEPTADSEWTGTNISGYFEFTENRIHYLIKGHSLLPSGSAGEFRREVRVMTQVSVMHRRINAKRTHVQPNLNSRIRNNLNSSDESSTFETALQIMHHISNTE